MPFVFGRYVEINDGIKKDKIPCCNIILNVDLIPYSTSSPLEDDDIEDWILKGEIHFFF